MDLSASQDGEVKIYFVLPRNVDQETCSPHLICAFQACREHDLDPQWLTTDACLSFEATKKDVFVCEPFDGEAFTFLTTNSFKSVVLGPRCLLTCLHTKKPVPEMQSPLHNMAFNKLVITSTGFDKNEKAELQTLVKWMSGIYSSDYHEGVTHLLAKTVGSKKYMVAAEKELPIMTGEWVKAVWKATNSDSGENVSATQTDFIKYTCPVFLNVNICVSQFPREEKNNLRKLIEENGGIYSSNLEMNITSVLIINSAEGEKFKHASQWRIPCLTMDWITDSIHSGHTLPMINYGISHKPKSSTPTGEHTIRGLPDVSICSTIMNETDNPTNKIDETVEADISASFLRPKKMETATSLREIEKLPLPCAMRAGLFLDGCKIFLSGFDDPLHEKLRRILNAGGASRYNHLSEAVSHIVIGKYIEEHHSVIDSWASKPLLVTPDWIVECVKNERTVDETPFIFIRESHKQPPFAKPHNDISLAHPNIYQGHPETNNETYVDDAVIQRFANGVTKDDSLNCSTLPDSQQTTQGIFQGKVFTVSGYPEDVVEQLIDVICSNRGEVAEMDYDGLVHFSIITVEGNGKLHPKAISFVSHFYIEECLEQETLVPVDYYLMPIHWPFTVKPLSNCVIAASIYKGKERTFLIHLATVMGATFQEMFAKKDNVKKGVRSSTHLVCPAPEGDKYKAAKKWGVPAVTCNWLLKCASLQSMVDESPFFVDEPSPHAIDAKAIILSLLTNQSDKSKASPPYNNNNDDGSFLVAPTPIDRKVKALKELHVDPVSAIRTPDPETIRRLYPTPGRKKSDDLDSMPTPDTPYGLTWFPNPSSRVRKGFKRAIDALPDDRVSKKPLLDPGTPEEVYYKRMTENIKNMLEKHKPPPKPQTDPKESHLPITSQTSSASTLDDESSLQSNSATGPLSGVVVYASRKLVDIQQDLYKAVAELGGDYVWNYDDDVTHFIHQGRPNDTQKEFRLARSQGKKIVSPEWVWMSKEEGQKVDENLFPHFHNPKMSLSLVSVRPSNSSRRKQRERIDEESQEDNEEHSSDETPSNNASKEENGNNSTDFIKQLEEIEALAKITSTSVRKGSINSLNNCDPNMPPVSFSPPPHKPSVLTETESQSTAAIAWDDPQEREARAKLQEGFVKDTQEILEQLQIEAKENATKKHSPLPTLEESVSAQSSPAGRNGNTTKLSYIFTLSGMSEEQRMHYTEVVQSLGGHMSENQTQFDPSVTHVITLKPLRSEKHLAAIASGKWILYTSFMDDSLKAGAFVQEEKYEFGNPSAQDNLPSFVEGALEYKLSKAAHRWRKKLSSTGSGAFYGMKAVIYSSRERVAAFSRLITVGGGQVVNPSPMRPSIEDMGEVTHCFVELNKNVKVDLAWFASRGVPCLLPVYLNEFLSRESPPDEMEECIPEYKKILHEMT